MIVLKNKKRMSFEGEFLKERILRVCEWQRSLLFPPRGKVFVDRNSEETSGSFCDFKDGRFDPLDNRAQHELFAVHDSWNENARDCYRHPSKSHSSCIPTNRAYFFSYECLATCCSSPHHKSFFSSLVCNAMFLDVKIYLFIR